MKTRILSLGLGNPGALNVLMQVYNQLGENATEIFDILEDMNIKGDGVWLAYKDASGENIDVMIKNLKNRSPELVEKVNKWYSSTAVVSGAK